MKEGIIRYRAVAKATLLMIHGLLLSTIAAAAAAAVVMAAATAAVVVVTADWATAVSPLYLQLQSI